MAKGRFPSISYTLGDYCHAQRRLFFLSCSTKDAIEQGNSFGIENHRYVCRSYCYDSTCYVFNAVSSFLELVPILFEIPEVTAFLSEKLCQDPLEKFFGCQRQRGRVNENPNAQAFCKNTQALRVVNSCMGAVRGNCRGSTTSRMFDTKENEPLPKRRHARSKTNSLFKINIMFGCICNFSSKGL